MYTVYIHEGIRIRIPHEVPIPTATISPHSVSAEVTQYHIHLAVSVTCMSVFVVFIYVLILNQ